MSEAGDRVVVIGAGIGGLSAALRLAAGGRAVTVVEAAEAPGGKMRTLPSVAGPVDAGPTVLTMRGVFDDLFAAAGARLEDHVRLIPQPVLARHWWPDGSTLDLFPDIEANAQAIAAFAGPREARAYRRFEARTLALWQAFDAPVMRAPRPNLAGIVRATLATPAAWPWLLPGRTLAGALAGTFRDPRLRQLFGRYATYVGGMPHRVPAVLGLVWQAEAAGVWAVEGGMHALARAVAALAEARGVTFRYGCAATRIARQGGRAAAVTLADGSVLPAQDVVFNGDPAALTAGLLGEAVRTAVPRAAVHPRSLSAWVWSFAARVASEPAGGRALVHHNVFFTADPRDEFGPIERGAMPEAPTLYICAEDRAGGHAPAGAERFEIIVNAPAGAAATASEAETCLTRTFPTLARFGLTFDPVPGPQALTRPADFARLFPASQGSLYGRSPEGALASFRRPAARTTLPGLWLCGGGAHPGAGVPMAALSGRHAAEGILNARISRSMSRRTDTPGGISTGSRTRAPTPSR